MGDFIQMNCPTCGGKLEIQKNAKSAVCQYCGNEHLIKPTEGGIPQDTYANCPFCKKDDKVEKVTAIIRRNTEKRAKKSKSKVSELATRLAPPDKPKLIPKPEFPLISIPQPKYLKKDYSNSGCGVLIIGIGGLMVPFVFSSYMSTITAIIIALLSIGVLMWGIVLLRSGNKKRKIDKKEYELKYLEYQKKYKKLQEEYAVRLEEVKAENEKIKLSRPNALKRWEKLYYCYRDDCVFIPEEGSYSSLSEIKDYIYQTEG